MQPNRIRTHLWLFNLLNKDKKCIFLKKEYCSKVSL